MQLYVLHVFEEYMCVCGSCYSWFIKLTCLMWLDNRRSDAGTWRRGRRHQHGGSSETAGCCPAISSIWEAALLDSAACSSHSVWHPLWNASEAVLQANAPRRQHRRVRLKCAYQPDFYDDFWLDHGRIGATTWTSSSQNEKPADLYIFTNMLIAYSYLYKSILVIKKGKLRWFVCIEGKDNADWIECQWN